MTTSKPKKKPASPEAALEASSPGPEFISAETTIYADQMAQVAIGPFVSKMTFGLDKKPGERPAAAVTIAIPTAALVAMASHLNAMLSSPDVHHALKNEVQVFIDSLPIRSEPEVQHKK